MNFCEELAFTTRHFFFSTCQRVVVCLTDCLSVCLSVVFLTGTLGGEWLSGKGDGDFY